MTKTTPSNKKTQWRYLLGIVAILATVYAVQTAGAPAYTLPLAEKKLHQLNDAFVKYAKISGRDAALHYNNISLIGFGPNKKANIDRLSLDILRPSWLNMERQTLSSENVEMLPNHMTPDSTLLQFSDVIHVITGSELSHTITPSLPLYLSSFSKEDGLETIQKLSLAKGASLVVDDKRAHYKLFFGDSLFGDSTIISATASWLASLHTGPASLQKNDTIWNVSNAVIRLNTIKQSATDIESKGTFTLDDITVANMPTKEPLSFNIAWNYKEALNVTGAEDSSELTIERGMLTNEQVKIASSGTLYFSVEDQEPYGELVLEISDVKILAASSWIAEDKRADFKKMLEDMIGQKLEKRTQEIIPIGREKNGEWKCGKIACNTLLERGMLDTLIFNQEKHHGEEHINSNKNPS